MTPMSIRTNVSVTVFVTSEKLHGLNGSGKKARWFNLNDYPDLKSFNEDVEKRFKVLGDEDPRPVFLKYHIDAPHDLTEGLISKNHISADLWELMNMDHEDAQLLKAYLWAFNTPKNNHFKDILLEAKVASVGRFNTREDFIKDYIDRCYGGIIDELPAELKANLDRKGVFEDIKHDYVITPGGYYFHISHPHRKKIKAYC